MTLVVWTFALLGAAIYILVFFWEVLLFQRPGVHQGIFFIPTADVPAVRLWHSVSASTTCFLAPALSPA
jgi:putative membrane protein